MAPTPMRRLAVAAAASAALIGRAAASTSFYRADDPSVFVSGRSQLNADGSRSFDWEATSFWLNLDSPTYVNIYINSTGPRTRLNPSLNGVDLPALWVEPSTNAQAISIVKDIGTTGRYTVRVFNSLEPSFSGALSPGQNFSFYGFGTDGAALPATPLSRRIEFVGDSISAGFGSLGNSSTPGCSPTPETSSNWLSWDNYVCSNFTANCSAIAWSGKGMYANCCDNGETMPSYYLQTLGSNAYSTDWDFARFTPDIMVINLGTNDMNSGKDNGTAWESAFVDAYVQFCARARQAYGAALQKIFVAQGSMNTGTQLKGLLDRAVSAVNAAGGSAVYMDLRGPPNDGCAGHPGMVGHAQIAELAIASIKQEMGW